MLLPLPALSTTVATLTSANTIRPTHVTFDRAHTNNRTYTFQQISTFDNDSSEKLQLVLKKENNDEEYCVLFEIVKATVACTKESPFSNLREGEKVCVQCDREAMRPSLGYRCSGHGTMDRSTRWSALSAPHCHGKWKRLDASKSSCRLCVNGPHYVFV